MNDPALEASYRQCARIARRSASSFYLSFWLLPRAKRQAMSALYAFLRVADDIGDNAAPLSSRQARLAAHRAALLAALAGRPSGPIFPALADAVRRYAIPPDYLVAALDGVEMDLNERQYETDEEVADYCHHVASVVGFACLHIWGFSAAAALEPAEQCGQAFQRTNILRDLAEDAAQGRCYLPRTALERHGYRWDDLRRGVANGAFFRLMEEQLAQTETLYQRARDLETFLDRDGRAIFGLMFETYHALLAEIAHRPAAVLTSRIRLGRRKKWSLAAKWLLGRPRTLSAARRAVAESLP
ncbi:MAG TPA: phytoene/squalene synthase family protein [Pirellulales bacterium]|jgi:phytoene synthase|nr:phytoene/squalene synthase family protein [Pirellulales bacterium]